MKAGASSSPDPVAEDHTMTDGDEVNDKPEKPKDGKGSKKMPKKARAIGLASRKSTEGRTTCVCLINCKLSFSTAQTKARLDLKTIGPDSPTCSQFPSDTEFKQHAKFRKGI